MADIFFMDRTKQSIWLRKGVVLAALLLPFNALGDKNMVIIVGEKPLEIDNAAAMPLTATAEAQAPQQAQPAPQIIEESRPPLTAKPVARPNIDILKQKDEALEFITLNSVLFSHNGTALDNTAKQVLNDIAAYLHNNDRAERLLINGFADKIASDAYNAKLSAKRAFVVREYLRFIGVPTTLLHTVSWGEGHPADEHWTINGRKRNRRVELYLVQKSASM